METYLIVYGIIILSIAVLLGSVYYWRHHTKAGNDEGVKQSIMILADTYNPDKYSIAERIKMAAEYYIEHN